MIFRQETSFHIWSHNAKIFDIPQNLHGSFQPARSAPLATIDDFGNDDLSPLETKSIAEDVSNVRQSSAVASTKPMEIKSAYKSPTALPLAGTPSKPRNIMTRMKNKRKAIFT